VRLNLFPDYKLKALQSKSGFGKGHQSNTFSNASQYLTRKSTKTILFINDLAGHRADVLLRDSFAHQNNGEADPQMWYTSVIFQVHTHI